MSWGTPTKVTYNPNTTGTSFNPAVTIPAGALVTVFVEHQGGQPVTVTDSNTIAYDAAASPNGDSQDAGATSQKRVAFFYKINASAATSLTITQGASSVIIAHIRIYTGADASGCTFRGGLASISSVNGSNIGPQLAGCVSGDLILGGVAYNETTAGTRFDTPNISGIFSDDTNTNALLGTSTTTLSSMYGVATASGTQGPQWSMSAATTGFVMGVFIKGSTSASVTPPVVQGTRTIGSPTLPQKAAPPTVQGQSNVPAFDALEIDVVLSPDNVHPATASIGSVTVNLSQSASITPPVVNGSATVGAVTLTRGGAVTASVVSGTTTIGSVIISAGVSPGAVTPAVVQGTTLTPPATPMSSLKVTTSVVNGSTSIGSTVNTTGGGATPSVIFGLVAIPQPVGSSSSLITPAVVAGTRTIGSPTFTTQVIVSPSVVNGITNFGTIASNSGTSFVANVVQGLVSIPQAGIINTSNATAAPSVVNGSTLTPPATVLSSTIASPATVSGSPSINTPVTFTGSLITPPVVFGNVSSAQPTLSTGLLVTPSVVQGTRTISSTTPTSDNSVLPGVILGTANISGNIVTTGLTALPSVVAGAAAIVNGSPFTGGGITVSPGVIPGLVQVPTPNGLIAALPMPGVITGAASLPSVTNFTGSVITPSVVQAYPYVGITDMHMGTLVLPNGISLHSGIFSPINISVTAAIAAQTVLGSCLVPAPNYAGDVPLFNPSYSFGDPEIVYHIGEIEYSSRKVT